EQYTFHIFRVREETRGYAYASRKDPYFFVHLAAVIHDLRQDKSWQRLIELRLADSPRDALFKGFTAARFDSTVQKFEFERARNILVQEKYLRQYLKGDPHGLSRLAKEMSQPVPEVKRRVVAAYVSAAYSKPSQDAQRSIRTSVG